MATVGFIGLGIMGAPMAANLVTKGHAVRGYSRTPATREAAAKAGIVPAADPREAVRDADFVITMLPDTPDVESVVFGEDGIFDAVAPGSVFIDMSTIEPGMARTLHARFAERGIAALDAPVSGGEVAAIAGNVSIMVGGESSAFDRAAEVLGAMGTTIVRVGGPSSGQSVKAANQLMVAGHLQMLAEALVFLRSQDVDLSLALDVISGGLAGSTVIERKRAAYLSANFAPGFRLELHHKDLGIVQRTARAGGVALPLTAAVTQFVQAMVAQGHGELDHSALYKLASEMNGQEL